MQNPVFRSRRNAIGFALLTVVGALALVGGQDGPGAVTTQRDEIIGQREHFERQMDEENASIDEPDREDIEDMADWDEPDSLDFDEGEDFVGDSEGLDVGPAIEDENGERYTGDE